MKLVDKKIWVLAVLDLLCRSTNAIVYLDSVVATFGIFKSASVYAMQCPWDFDFNFFVSACMSAWCTWWLTLGHIKTLILYK